MFGLMLIEMESFNELKQASGYGVVLQKDVMEERWGWWSKEAFLRADVAGKKNVKRITDNPKIDEAIIKTVDNCSAGTYPC